MTDVGLTAYFDPDLAGRRVLRRYLDLPKLVDFLRTGELFLGQATSFEDRLEGTLPERIRKSIRERPDAYAYYGDPVEWEIRNKSRTYLGCWTLGTTDNMALWKLYGGSAESVAITTTVNRLAIAAPRWAAYGTVNIKKIKYIDHSGRLPNGAYTFSEDIFGFKHHAYAFEREVRVIITCPMPNENMNMPHALRVPVDIGGFLKSIVVAPDAGDWFYELVEDIAKKYGVNKCVRRSSLTQLIEKASRDQK
jgi:hypothetical protein